MARDTPYNVLFLCTGNSARSIMAEALMNHLGKGRFVAHSAGSDSAGRINPLTVETLRALHVPIENLRSKSWEEFARPDAPSIDFIFTVCDKAAGEACPVWPGKPITAAWGVDDPAAFEGPAERKGEIFRNAALALRRRIELFLALPVDALDAISVQRRLDEIGRSE